MKNDAFIAYLTLLSMLIPIINGESDCGVYFAPSTIPGAGYGMYAGQDYRVGDQVTPGDLIVAYTDMAFHNGIKHDDGLPFLWNA
jgi:hypothetical protein